MKARIQTGQEGKARGRRLSGRAGAADSTRHSCAGDHKTIRAAGGNHSLTDGKKRLARWEQAPPTRRGPGQRDGHGAPSISPVITTQWRCSMYGGTCSSLPGVVLEADTGRTGKA